MADLLFEPLVFRNLVVKNRIWRSSISGRIDNYDGSGTLARVRWVEMFARGGVGAIVSAHVPVHVRGRILPNYAMIDRDERIPFWRQIGEVAHANDCAYIMQIAHSGRQQDIPGIENKGKHSLSSTTAVEKFHGFVSRAMTLEEIASTQQLFVDAARRAREAGLDGIELHAANGYLFTQFLSSAINDREDDYGGTLENRARFLLETVAKIRREVGDDFHFQVKLSAVDYHNAVTFWEGRGNTLDDSLQVAKWLEEAGVDALHVSTGSMFPHPRNPPGDFPLDVAGRTYESMLMSGTHAFRNYLIFRFRPLRPIARYLWHRTQGPVIEGLSLPDAHAIKAAVKIPVLCTGGFQTASLIRKAIENGDCDAVTIARPLMANPDLPKVFAAGRDQADKPCTYCNRCLINVLENPLGCYDITRFDGDYDLMMKTLMAFYADAVLDPAALQPPQEEASAS